MLEMLRVGACAQCNVLRFDVACDMCASLHRARRATAVLVLWVDALYGCSVQVLLATGLTVPTATPKRTTTPKNTGMAARTVATTARSRFLLTGYDLCCYQHALRAAAAALAFFWPRTQSLIIL